MFAKELVFHGEIPFPWLKRLLNIINKLKTNESDCWFDLLALIDENGKDFIIIPAFNRNHFLKLNTLLWLANQDKLQVDTNENTISELYYLYMDDNIRLSPVHELSPSFPTIPSLYLSGPEKVKLEIIAEKTITDDELENSIIAGLKVVRELYQVDLNSISLPTIHVDSLMSAPTTFSGIIGEEIQTLLVMGGLKRLKESNSLVHQVFIRSKFLDEGAIAEESQFYVNQRIDALRETLYSHAALDPIEYINLDYIPKLDVENVGVLDGFLLTIVFDQTLDEEAFYYLSRFAIHGILTTACSNLALMLSRDFVWFNHRLHSKMRAKRDDFKNMLELHALNFNDTNSYS